MVKLDRKNLSSGTFLDSFRNAPGIEWWTKERIEASMQEMLARRPKDTPIWLFAYGSLICNPVFDFVERQHAMLNGWHRSFCIRLVLARGSVEQPGRMLALEPGGITYGLALRLRDEDLENELRMVWMRELVGGVYHPEWAEVTLEDGRIAHAIVFAANTNNVLYESDASPDAVAPAIAIAHGSLGSNRDYVLQLNESLHHHGIVDSYIHELATRLEQ